MCVRVCTALLCTKSLYEDTSASIKKRKETQKKATLHSPCLSCAQGEGIGVDDGLLDADVRGMYDEINEAVQ